MSSTTLLVLLLLTCGQVLILGIGFLVLWMAGEFDDGGARSVSKSRPLRRWALWARASGRRLRRRLGRSVMARGRLSYSRVMVSSLMVVAAVASVLIAMKAVERSRTASVPLAGATDGSNRTLR